ncbi:MAG: sn-glycerol-3-phosphate ABC transporter ATP-binding protein UgpC [SAR324 cluster bacterium]|jgi:ABC-type sugar transport system ATPase subunit|nr:glycerol-3-phosphate ABC transporter ATP-binding protein [Pseudomonadota bacterium]MAE08922.1 glycerol-3-phosphate ABC transporter ATP-binding protein [Bacteroidota bacterium]MBP44395.1 glycerol-3-phosphate ABC transporter ATP-binding protein [Deltaproteobacteria bacterium]MDP6090418.1 sn-glycerol-3-phosphate ABC transporter ATP-binding protein UgpC [SAR324 cluster bacterium]MDP7498573.1 sn-glycerol-3-phosphate ABC transporter ATP-binding protein UgpC [SAR324 cluster bacterium]|tara:strand:+ start:1848 stop:2945 length:1098 start_codon:yes stop_codon:yes gene_type:complete
MAEIELNNLTKIYPNNITAVQNISLKINEGEFIVFLGPSGCGKSTILRMIAGLESITSGEIKINNKIVNNVDSSERDLAIVFQNYALYPHMSVFGNLSFGLKLRKTSKSEIEKRVSVTSEILEINHLLTRKPKELSGGQQQRVALGRALVRDPVAFLFDEPLSNLDAKLRGIMRTELIKLHRKLNSTIIHVTHDQVEAMTMGDRICILNRGEIIQIGSPLEIYNNPVNTFVAGFLASPPMNLINSKISISNSKIDFYLSDNKITLPVKNYPHLQLYNDNEIIIGIRPEDLYVHQINKNMQELNVNVLNVEALGPETILVVTFKNGKEIYLRVEKNYFSKYNERIRLYFDQNKLKFFDSLTQNAIF